MLNLKFSLPYLCLVAVMCYLQFIIPPDDKFINLILKQIDYLVTDISTSKKTNFSEIDLSVFSDEMVCEKIALVKIYPELSDFLKEAKRRRLYCHFYNVNTLYFYSSLL